MPHIADGKKYQFIPPYESRFWAGVIPRIFPFYLRAAASIEAVHFAGLERLTESLARGNRVILASNHSRPADPMLLAVLSTRIRQPFFYLTSWHAFLESKVYARLIRVLGGFSIKREGIDRKALQAASDILVHGKRPLVIFPEGEVSRANDHLFPFLQGISFIAKTATQNSKRIHDIPPRIVVHPVAIKYVLSRTDEKSLHQALDSIEASRSRKTGSFPLLKRIVQIGKDLLAEKELEFLGSVQKGEVSKRALRLKEFLIENLEREWHSLERLASLPLPPGSRPGTLRGIDAFGTAGATLEARRSCGVRSCPRLSLSIPDLTVGEFRSLALKPKACFMSRVNSLRSAVLREISWNKGDKSAAARGREALKKIDFSVRLSNYPADYLRAEATLEKMTETIQRLQEDALNRKQPLGRWKAHVEVGPEIEAGASEEAVARLPERVFENLACMLDALKTPPCCAGRKREFAPAF